jgi:hypothetical protein
MKRSDWIDRASDCKIAVPLISFPRLGAGSDAAGPIPAPAKVPKTWSIDRKQARSLFDSPFAPTEPSGLLKMSNVLKRFVEPYVGESLSAEILRNVFALAVVAWNTALVSEDQQRSMIDDLLETAFSRSIDADRQDARELLQDIIDRKIAYFSTVRRPIHSYELRDTGDGFYLSVLSGLPVPPGL